MKYKLQVFDIRWRTLDIYSSYEIAKHYYDWLKIRGSYLGVRIKTGDK